MNSRIIPPRMMIPSAMSFAAVKKICTLFAVSTLIILIAAKTTAKQKANCDAPHTYAKYLTITGCHNAERDRISVKDSCVEIKLLYVRALGYRELVD